MISLTPIIYHCSRGGSCIKIRSRRHGQHLPGSPRTYEVAEITIEIDYWPPAGSIEYYGHVRGMMWVSEKLGGCIMMEFVLDIPPSSAEKCTMEMIVHPRLDRYKLVCCVKPSRERSQSRTKIRFWVMVAADFQFTKQCRVCAGYSIFPLYVCSWSLEILFNCALTDVSVEEISKIM